MDLEVLRRKFEDYAKQFDMEDKNIIRKFYHSYRVMDLCMLLAKYNNFNEEDMKIAMLVGLLHDYSRFEQWTKYKTYVDKRSIDHGDLAVERLFEDGEIINYCNNKRYYDEIYDAIKYHNKYEHPNTLSEHNKLLCKIVRDADKLDIFYLMGIDDDLIIEDNNEISTKIKDDFYRNKSLNHFDVNNCNDSIILRLGMVFDLNFDYSFKYLYDMKLIDKIFVNIKDKDKFKRYFDYVNKYIENKIN